jgi:hypothetical protein
MLRGNKAFNYVLGITKLNLNCQNIYIQDVLGGIHTSEELSLGQITSIATKKNLHTKFNVYGYIRRRKA